MIEMSQQKQDDSNYVTLVLKQRKEFRASRNVLSAASPFFSAILDSDMREKKEGIIRLEHISDTVMRDVLEFMNSGTVKLTSANVQDLIEAADYLVLPSLKTIAGRFIEKNLSTSNCISIYYFAEKYQCEELMVNTRKFISSLDFANVAKSRDFLDLESQQVEEWISNDEINVSKEDDVFKIILKWIEQSKSDRKGKFEELFRHLRLALLSHGYLERDIVTNDLVKENPGCLKLVRDAVNGVGGANDDDLQQTTRKMFEAQAIVVYGGKAMFCYLPDKDSWYQMQDSHSEHRRYHVTSFKEKLYVFPRRRNPAYYYERSSMYAEINPERYDPSLNSWMSLAREEENNWAFRSSVVVMGSEIISIEHVSRRRDNVFS